MIELMLLGGYHSNYFSAWALPFGMIFLIIVEGLPLWIFGLLGLAICLSRRSENYRILIGWLILSLLSISIARLYGHNFAQLVAPLAVLCGISMGWLFNNGKILGNLIPRINFNNITKKLIFIILILTILPSVFFQTLQYPNFNIYWDFFHWEYEDSLTYNQQITLPKFLTQLNSTFLIHGWTALPYWLTGKMAPLAGYTATVPHQSLGILMPQEDYQILLKMVENRSFDHIVIFSTEKGRLYQETDDQITFLTIENYFYFKTIGNAQIFSKYDSYNRRVGYNFITNFQKAKLQYETSDAIIGEILTDIEDEIFIPKVAEFFYPQVPENSRAILQLPMPTLKSRVTFENITINANSTLEFGIITHPDTWFNLNGDGVEFEISIEYNETNNIVFSKYINPKHDITDRKLFNFSVNLDDYTDKYISIVFSTLPGPSGDIFDDWAYWVDPLILEGES
jgi:hypothetical protein